MSTNKLDKSVVVTAFVCAIAAFVCGFMFSLSLLSNSKGCYLMVKDFWTTTRGYIWFKELHKLNAEQIFEIVGICGAILFVAALSVMLVRRCKRCKNCAAQANDKSSSYAKSTISYADENDVSAVLQNCRRNPEAASWDKINSLSAEILADYLKNEYPQVAAVVLSKISPLKSAAVINLLSGGFGAEVIIKMLNSRSLDAELVGDLGKSIAEDIENNQETNSMEQVAAIWSNLNKNTEQQILGALENYAPSIAEALRHKTTRFEDLLMLSSEQIKQVIRLMGEPKLVIALRGASDELRNHIYTAMPSKQSDIIREALQRLGPIKLRDIEKAQQDIVSVCKKMFADTLRGEGND